MMEVVLNREAFQRVLAAVNGIVSGAGLLPVPVQNHFRLTASDGKVFVEATNLEVSLRQKVEGRVVSPGEICLPAKKAFGIVKELSYPEVSLKEEGNFWVSLSAQRVSLRLPGLDPKDLPDLTPDGAEAFTVPSGTLKKMVRKVAFCAYPKEQYASMNLHGIFVEAEEGQLILVATDGHRLALCRERVEGASGLKAPLPKKGFLELKKVFGDDEELKVFASDTVVRFEGTEAALTVRVLEGRYPDYRVVLPQDLPNRAVLNREEFAAALRRAEVFARETGEGVKIAFSDGALELRAGKGDTGEVHEKVLANYEGTPLTATFNPRYLIEALSVMEGERVIFELRDSESAARLREEDNEDYLYVVMPMRIVDDF